MKHKLIYCYDALCGWCYGFSPSLQFFVERHQAELEVEVLSGGMITGDRIGPIGTVASYIHWAYKEVEQRTGVTFGHAFLNDTLKTGTATFTSIPAAIAMCVFKAQLPNRQLSYATRLQQGIYYDGIHPTDFAAYEKMAKEKGWEGEDFQGLMRDERYEAQAQQSFQRVKAMGVSGFPTLLLQKGETLYTIAHSAVSLDYLEQSYEHIK